jgi:hypothetical protein
MNIIMRYFESSNTVIMETLTRLENEAALIMANGGPVSERDFDVMRIWRALHTNSKPRKDHGAKGKKARIKKARS